jgi:hypothetical protein
VQDLKVQEKEPLLLLKQLQKKQQLTQLVVDLEKWT